MSQFSRHLLKFPFRIHRLSRLLDGGLLERQYTASVAELDFDLVLGRGDTQAWCPPSRKGEIWERF